MNILNINDVSKTIKKKCILSNIRMTITSGEVVGLVGPNGAGKTSLMKLIAGYNFPTKGSIEIGGHNVRSSHAAAMKEAAFLVEEPGLYPSLSGQYHLKTFGNNLSANPEAMNSAMEFINFEGQLKNKVSTYSLGMKQRLALALCWANAPKLMVLDEPVNGLDPDGIFLLREKIAAVCQNGTAVLVSSHLLSELQKIATRFVFINRGVIVGEENASEDEDALESRYRSLFPRAGEEVSAQ